MTRDRDFKRTVRERAARTGERYAAARYQLAPPPGGPPAHWAITGSHPQQYAHRSDPAERHGGQRVARLRHFGGPADGFGATVQVFSAAEFLGQRVRFAASLRAEEVTGWTGLWFRVDGPDSETLAFDNMESRALSGSTDWTPCSIMLDVPEGARTMLIGVVLAGAGEVATTGLSLTVAADDEPVTAQDQGVLERPRNLGFDED